MFKKRQRQMGNAAAAAMPMPARPSPERVVYTQPARPYASIIFTLFVCVVALGPVIWVFGVFILGQAGYKKPERAMAEVVIIILVVLPSVIFISWFISHGLGKILSHKEVMRQMDLEAMRYTSAIAAQPRIGESRLTDEDSRFCALLRVVMDEAYRHIYRDPEQPQQYTKSDVKPWSREPNNGRIILGISEPVKFNEAARVRDWLTKEDVIRRDEVNLERYPSFAHFEALLEKKFYTPIQVNGASPPLLDSGYVPIENS